MQKNKVTSRIQNLQHQNPPQYNLQQQSTVNQRIRSL